MRFRAPVLLWLLAAPACSTSVLQRMDAQQKFIPYAANDFFDDGRAMRPSVEGTVAREQAPSLEPPGGVTGSTVEDGNVVQRQFAPRNPLPVTRALLEQGRRRFEITCAACHGLLGDGDSVVAHKMALRTPPSLHDFAGRPDGFFYTVISEGYGMMAPYAAEIPPAERWAVVAYVRALQLSQNAPLSAAPPDVRARLLSEGTP